MHPQQPQGQPHYQQAHPQQGMQQMPYYPPQKQGMPGWAWALIICGIVVVLMIVGIMFLAAIPLMTSNSRDARRAEGEQLMGSAKGEARVAYSREGEAPDTFSSIGALHVLQGRYYSVDDRIQTLGGDQARITCSPTESGDSKGSHEFHWNSGQGKLYWD